MQKNWGLKLNVTISADDDESLVLFLRDIAKRIKKGNLAGLEHSCAGVAEYRIYKQPRQLTTHSTGLATNTAIESSSLAGTVSNEVSVANTPAG